MKVGRRQIEIGNADKVLFRGDGITKRDLAAYYRDIAEVMLPHLRGRPVAMQRFPDGIAKRGFYQKDVPKHFPGWVRTAFVSKESGSLHQVVVENAATLVYLADQAVVTPHVWLSRVGRIARPDRMVFDLDPPGRNYRARFDNVRWAARRLRELLERIGFVPFVQTTGSRGLHVVVPIDRGQGFDEVRALARAIARRMAVAHPGRLTVEQRRAKRGRRVFIDVLRNAWGQTVVAPYAVRARPGAPVATPLDWRELDRSDLGPRRHGLDSVRRRLGQKEDPWAGMGRRAHSLEVARRALQRLDGSVQSGRV